MATKNEIKRIQEYYRAEHEAIALYTRLADAEKNPSLAAVYRKLVDTEQRHADHWKTKILEAGGEVPSGKPGIKTRLMGWLASRLGAQAVVPAIARIERGAATQYDGVPDAEAAKMPADERSHARIFGMLSLDAQGVQGSDLARFEGRHRAGGGNALRAAVLGANDGLVSVFCLVMGVAGAGVGSRQILMTGLAGMLAGALSMALGEWLSVQSSRELYRNQMDIEKRELAETPLEEKEELSLIYQAKGLDAATAAKLADRLLSDPSSALDTLAREELGIDPEELGGSAWEAAFMSFLLFTVGAIIPVVPYVFFTGTAGVIASAAASTLGLFVIGAAITLMTGRHFVFSGMRQVLFGLVTAGITFGVGHLIGVSLAG